jgi:hypothetical protein
MIDLRRHTKDLENQITEVTRNMQEDLEDIEKMIENLIFCE